MVAALGLVPPRAGLTRLALLPASPRPRCDTAASLHVTRSPAGPGEPRQLHGRGSRAPQRRLCTHAGPGGGAVPGLPPRADGGELARASAVAAELGPRTLHAAEVGSLARRIADADPPNALEARSLVLALSRAAAEHTRARLTERQLL